jgi:hypothetical protein
VSTWLPTTTIPYITNTIPYISATNNTITTYTSMTNGPEVPVAGQLSAVAVHTMKGWWGQVRLGEEVVWESRPRRSREKATAQANKRIKVSLTRLLS